MPTPSTPSAAERIANYKAARAAARAEAEALSAEAGVPICHKCGELCLDGTNFMSAWPGARCNTCAQTA